MVRKIRLTTIFIIVVILICGISAIVVVRGQKIDPVSDVKMTQSTASSIKIKWSSVKGADGYRIYLVNDEAQEPELYSEVEGQNESSFTFEGVEGATVYNIRVTAFKYFRRVLYESEEAQQLMIYSQPEKAVQASYSPIGEMLTIEWEPQQNALGFEVEYAKDKGFNDAVSENIDSGEQVLHINSLTALDTFYTRVRSYADIDGKRLYGEWSDTGEVIIREKVIMPESIDPDKPMIALSFDDGPGYYFNGSNPTSEILDVLEKYGARATFFMCASRFNYLNEDCLEREIALGCELGNHTYDHTHYGRQVTSSDITSCSNKIKELCGRAPTIFRCPGGSLTQGIRNECKRQGMPIAHWSIDTEDWKSLDPVKTYNIAINNAYDGAIILMHDIYPTTAQAVKWIVPKLIDEGYQVVGVSEMLMVKNGGTPPTAGNQYKDYQTQYNETN